MTNVLGLAAASWALLMALSPLLQVREIKRRASSAGLSISYFAVLLVGFTLWVAYGIAGNDLPLIVPNCVALAVTIYVVAIALRYRR